MLIAVNASVGIIYNFYFTISQVIEKTRFSRDFSKIIIGFDFSGAINGFNL